MKAMNHGKVSVIIPKEPGGSVRGALAALAECGFDGKRLEVLVAEGRQPSRQRNLAARRAKGGVLMFLDSDSLIQKECLQRHLAALARPRAAVSGGPNLPPPGQGFFQSAVSLILASWFGSMSVRARYRALGEPRLTTEKELILCNLMVKREVFLGEGGFREDLYPNEENEFLNRLRDKGHLLYYDPGASVLRPRRASLWAYMVQSFRYGRGRMSQIFANFHGSDLVHAVPLAFFFYLLFLPALAAWLRPAVLPLAVYLAADLAASAVLWIEGANLRQSALGLALYPIRHIFYGLGMACGIVSRPKAADGEVKIFIARLPKH